MMTKIIRSPDAEAADAFREHFKSALRCFANSVSAITTMHEGRRYGLTSTAVCCITMERPTLMISVNKTASSHDPIVHSARFCVNLLKEAQTDVAKRFSGFFGHKGEDRFGGAQWSTLQTGAPALVGALASFDCEVAETKAFQSHTIFFGTVVAIAAEQGGFDPLLYVNRDYAALRIVNG